jgi:hypothetical protein
VNATADYSDSDYYQVSAVLQADGGHASSSGSTGDAPSGGNGTIPSRAVPTGDGAPSSASSAASSLTAIAEAAASSPAESCSS